MRRRRGRNKKCIIKVRGASVWCVEDWMTHASTEVDARYVVYDFVPGRDYYNPNGSGASGSLHDQTGQEPAKKRTSTAAAPSDSTSHKWYVTDFSQPYTGTGSDDSAYNDEFGPPSDDDAPNSAKTGEVQSPASKEARPCKMRMWHITLRAIRYSCGRRLVTLNPI